MEPRCSQLVIWQKVCFGETHRLTYLFDVLCDIVANNQADVEICGFYDGFTLIFD